MRIDNFNTGGLPPSADQALLGPHPDDPEATETFAVWLYDGAQDLGLEVRIHPHAGVASGWATILLSDGRILHAEPESAPFERADQPRTEHVKYEVLEPFHRWRYRLVDLPMGETTEKEMASGPVTYSQPTVTVTLDLQGTMVAPAWIQGSLLPESAEAMKGPAGLWIAGRLNSGMSPTSFRYDQALAATGTLRVGSQTIELRAYGLRGHVRGVRKMDGFASHTWMAAVFPESGRAFGIQCHRRHGAAGGYEFNESYVFQDGVLYPTRAIYVPPLSRPDPYAPFEVQLACDQLGLVQLTGRDTHVLWTSLGPLGLGTPPEQQRHLVGLSADAPYAMTQAVTRYDWAGEPGYGMDERSG
jgi:hypothetical protein